MAKSSYSNDGIKCPACGHLHRPDEPFYYSAHELDCVCGARLVVHPFCSWSWRTTLSEPAPAPAEKAVLDQGRDP